MRLKDFFLLLELTLVDVVQNQLHVKIRTNLPQMGHDDMHLLTESNDETRQEVGSN